MEIVCEQTNEPTWGAGFFRGSYARASTSSINDIINTLHCGYNLIRASKSTSKPKAPGNFSKCGVARASGSHRSRLWGLSVPGGLGGSHLSRLGVGRAGFTSVRSSAWIQDLLRGGPAPPSAQSPGDAQDPLPGPAPLQMPHCASHCL